MARFGFPRTALLVTLLGIGVGTAANAWAAFEDIEVSPRARAMGGAWTAVRDDAYAVFHNPASLAWSGRIQAGASTVRPFGYDFSSQSTAAAALALPGRWGGLGAGVRAFGVELKQVRAAGRRGDRANGASRVIAATIMTRRHEQAYSARDFVSSHERGNKVLAGRVFRFGQRQDRRQDRRAPATLVRPARVTPLDCAHIREAVPLAASALPAKAGGGRAGRVAGARGV